jgi:putative transposase
MIDRSHDLPITRQAQVLEISRSGVYYLPRAISAADLAIMRRIDQLHLDFPFAGSRMLRDLLTAEGFKIGRQHVTTLMKHMSVEALYRKPNTSKPAPGHKIYPYLLRNLQVTRPNQVWAMDITYIPMARGFVYLAAVVDWFSRRVLAWRLSITLGQDSAPRRWKKRSPATAGRTSSTPIKEVSSLVPSSPASSSGTVSPSAWTAGVLGATTSLSSASGDR